MAEPESHESRPDSGPSPACPSPLRWSIRAAAIAWIAGVVALGLAWGQHHWQVPHPHPLPLLLLLATMTLAAVASLGSGLRRAVTGPRRLPALLCATGALLPPLAWTAVGLYAQTQWQQRRVPHDLPMGLAKVLGVTLMRLEAACEYPNRLETSRLVMVYDRLEKPHRDAEAMDRHLARMEGMLGGPLRSKVYWVRGRLPRLGQGSLCVHGLALGSGMSPPDWGSGGALDRHELAHAALDQYRARDADPAYFLHEGWAESQSGAGPAELARRALEQREADPSLRMRDLVSPDWYHRDLGPVYTLGGAFADFLIRRHGAGRFLRLYNEGRPGTFDAACRAIIGCGLDDLEVAFWDEARRQAARRSERP